MERIKQWIANNKFLLIILLLFGIGFYYNYHKLTLNKIENASNIEALYDTISTYRVNNDILVSSKKILEGEVSLLSITNESLYNVIKQVKLEDASQVVYIKSEIEIPQVDTVYIINNDDSISSRTYNFNFSNNYRELTGNIIYSNDSIRLNFEKNKINADLSVLVKDANVYVSSSNPYLNIKNIEGVVSTTSYKSKRWGIGPSISYGYNVSKQNFDVNIGISVHYSLIEW